MSLFIRNVALIVAVAFLAGACGLAPGLPATEFVLDISDIMQFLEDDKWRSISQLIKGKSRDQWNNNLCI